MSCFECYFPFSGEVMMGVGLAFFRGARLKADGENRSV